MARAYSSESSCGIRVASSQEPKPADAVLHLKSQIGGGDFQHVIVHFSVDYDAGEVCAEFAKAFPGIPVTGCTTAGEIGPGGMSQGGMVAIVFPKQGFRIVADVIEGVEQFGVERATNTVRKLQARISEGRGDCARSKVFAMLLVDGLSNYEEMLVATINWAMGDVQLVGGSAGDALAFNRTTLIHEGRTLSNAAILLMIDSVYLFRAFKTQNFEPTPAKLVVTSADTENRVVHELNAEVAAHEYARVIGLMPEDLGPFSFASYPLVVKVGEEYYCRSIRNMNPDGSLSFFCAIDEGLVFTVARPHDMIESTEASFGELEQQLGKLDLVLGFDCVLRRLDAENRQIRHRLDDLYRKYNVVGFHTYGEQYNAMHLNQTMTGIAFGSRQTGT